MSQQTTTIQPDVNVLPNTTMILTLSIISIVLGCTMLASFIGINKI